MTSQIKRMCKLCLKTIDGNSFQTLEGENKQILEILLLQDIESTERCTICIDCFEMVQKCFEFKSCCLYVEDYISPFIRNCTKIDIGQVLQKKAEVVVDTDVKLCRLCIDVVKDNSCIYLDQNESLDIVEAVRNCLPELNVSAVYNPLICEKCINCLKEYRSFQKQCRKSNNFSKLNKLDTSSNSNNESIEKNGYFVNLVDDDCNLENHANEKISCLVGKGEKQQHTQIKKYIENEYIGDSENDFQITTKADEVNNISTVENVKPEDIDIKYELLENMGLPSTENGETLSVTYNKTCSEAIKPNDTLKHKSLSVGNSKNTGSSSEIKYKDNVEENVSINLDCSKTTKYECNTYSCKTRIKSTLVHECNICSYKTRKKSNWQQHMLIHEDPSTSPIYECHTCSYKARRKKTLETHMLVHKDPSKIVMYECNTCPFKTKHKGNLKKHMLIHKEPSKTPMFECTNCLYKTRWKTNLRKHMLVHANPAKITMYDCNICPFKTRWKSYLQKHMLVHTDPSKTVVHECSSCPFKSRHKGYFQRHILLHTNPPKTVMHECNSCSYKSRHKQHLRSHMLVHMDPSEITMYECNTCHFKTRWKHYLQTHMLLHRDPSKAPIYERHGSYKS